jgi:hypothetical protein
MPCVWRSNRNIMIRLSLLLDGVGPPAIDRHRVGDL